MKSNYVRKMSGKNLTVKNITVEFTIRHIGKIRIRICDVTVFVRSVQYFPPKFKLTETLITEKDESTILKNKILPPNLIIVKIQNSGQNLTILINKNYSHRLHLFLQINKFQKSITFQEDISKSHPNNRKKFRSFKNQNTKRPKLLAHFLRKFGNSQVSITDSNYSKNFDIV